MTGMMSVLASLSACWPLMTAIPVHAQAPTAKPMFKQVISEPTGRNGYEELVLACDRLQASRREWEGKPLTLSEKRLLLADKPVKDALQLVRRGLSKPITSPRTTLTIATPLPEYSGFRRLARLLMIQQYVQFADGKEAEALSTLHLGLNFGRAVQTDGLISGLVGSAISSLLIRNTAKHLDQLSAQGTEQLFRICVEHLRLPNPLPSILRAEHQLSRSGLRELIPQIENPGSQAGLTAEEKEAARQLKELSPPGQSEMPILQAQRRLDQLFALAVAESVKEPWKRNWSMLLPARDENEDPVGPLLQIVLPSLESVNHALIRRQSELQLLATHAAIRRYRWEHGRLPADLQSLNLGPTATDPFSGLPLRYQENDGNYQLFSIGQPTSSDDPEAIDGRRPVSLTPLLP